MQSVNEVTGYLTLKIKGQSLTDEAKYILRTERKLKRSRARTQSEERKAELAARLGSVQDHRRGIIRREARSTHLARMLLKGTPYLLAERACRKGNAPEWERVTTLLSTHARLDVRVARQRVEGWKAEPLPGERAA